jgi:hypothetical protein
MRKRDASSSAGKGGFWADVRELRDLIALKVSQGHGRNALREAMKQQIRDGAAQTVDAGTVEKGLKGLPAPLAEMLSTVPPGQQVRMSAAEYKALTKK